MGELDADRRGSTDEPEARTVDTGDAPTQRDGDDGLAGRGPADTGAAAAGDDPGRRAEAGNRPDLAAHPGDRSGVASPVGAPGPENRLVPAVGADRGGPARPVDLPGAGSRLEPAVQRLGDRTGPEPAIRRPGEEARLEPAVLRIEAGGERPEVVRLSDKAQPAGAVSQERLAADAAGMTGSKATSSQGTAPDSTPDPRAKDHTELSDKPGPDGRSDRQIATQLEGKTGKSVNDLVLGLGRGPISITMRELEAELQRNGTIKQPKLETKQPPVIDNVPTRHPNNPDRFVTEGRVGPADRIAAAKAAGERERLEAMASGLMAGGGARKGSASDGLVRPSPAGGGRPPGGREVAPNLARGNFGERAATDALAHDGHTIISYKPDVRGTNQGGIDMVTMKGGTVYFVDNKALTRDGKVSSVSALTTNFENNKAAVLNDLKGALNQAGRSPQERAVIESAIKAIENGDFKRVVTNANVTPDDKILSGVSGKLQAQGIEFVDVFKSQGNK